jgi:hypothetical protein
MIKLLKIDKWSFVVWMLAFLASPLPYRGACTADVGTYCPSWIFWGGFSYIKEIFNYIKVAIEDPFFRRAALGETETIIISLVVPLFISWLLVHFVFAIFRYYKNK